MTNRQTQRIKVHFSEVQSRLLKFHSISFSRAGLKANVLGSPQNHWNCVNFCTGGSTEKC